MNREIRLKASNLLATVSKHLMQESISPEELKELIRTLDIIQEALESALNLDAFIFALEMRRLDGDADE